MAQTKATKKFEKHHLRDTLERRKGLKKTKQKQQLKAKKKARRAEEEGHDAKSKESAPVQNGRTVDSEKHPLADMSVDDFFTGGFDLPEMPKQKSATKKRKRTAGVVEQSDEGSNSDADSQTQRIVADDSDSASESDEAEDHQAQLDALAQRDPDFFRHLQENEPELLDAGLDDMILSGDESDEPARKKSKKSKTSTAGDDSEDEEQEPGEKELVKKTVLKWSKALSEQHSLRAAKEVVLAFRAASHVSDDEEGKEFKYSISSPEVYHLLTTTALKHIPLVLQHHLPVQEGKSGKVKVDTESKKFKTLTPLLKSHIASTLHLLEHLSDPQTLRLTLTSILPLLPYLLSFKKIVRDVAKATSTIWSSSSSTEATRIAAFLVLRRLMVVGDPGIRENVLKAAYQGLIQGCRGTTVHTIAGVNLMKNSGAELFGIDTGVGYTTAFTFIRQLAIHLRQCITKNNNEAYKAVYNWQYIHSLDFWSRTLSTHAAEDSSPLRPLIYPLVQVTLGALRLIPTATYFPLRFQLIRSLLRISRTTGTYIPLAPALYEVLNSAEMRKSPKPATLKPLDFSTSIRAPKSYLRTRTYQDGVGEQTVELLGEYFVMWSKSIAFPELSLAVTVMVKRWLKDVNSRNPGQGNRNQKVNTSVQLLVQKLEANAKWIEERRAKVDFAPNDRRGVEGFLRDVDWTKTPLGAFVEGQRKVRDEKARVADQARQDDEAKKDEERKARALEKAGDRSESEDEADQDSDDSEDIEMEDGNGEEVESDSMSE